MPLLQVIRGLGAGFANGTSPPAALTTLAHQVVTEFIQAQLLDGRGYQVRNLGTITSPSTGDVDITDTDAEMCADAASGTTIIPFEFSGHLESLNGGTVPEVHAKSVTVVSNAGTAFTPLPLKTDGSAAVSTARSQAAGATQVPAELSTNTTHHFSWLQATVGTGENRWLWEPLRAPVLAGARCFYIQIAGATAGPLYFARFNYIEGPTLLYTPS